MSPSTTCSTADGLVARLVHAQVPPRVDCRLTARGETLRPIILAMKGWGERFAVPREAGPAAAA